MAQFYYKSGSSWVNALNLFYPTGAIYASTTSTSPGTLFGGTWQQITNAALRAATASIATYTGSDTHTLTVNEMPSHNHNNTLRTAWGSGDNGSEGFYEYRSFSSVGSAWRNGTDNTGGGAAHSIVQRSYNCYMWRRTA